MTGSTEVETAVASAFGRLTPAQEAQVARDAADFRRVGLSQAAAGRAARALGRGTYRTFEEAAVLASAFGSAVDGRPSSLNRAALAEVVKDRGKAEAEVSD